MVVEMITFVCGVDVWHISVRISGWHGNTLNTMIYTLGVWTIRITAIIISWGIYEWNNYYWSLPSNYFERWTREEWIYSSCKCCIKNTMTLL